MIMKTELLLYEKITIPGPAFSVFKKVRTDSEKHTDEYSHLWMTMVLKSYVV